MNSSNPEQVAEEVKAALFAGNKIGAIKIYRSQVSVSLGEAKTAVEKLAEELRISEPERFLHPAAVPNAAGSNAGAIFLVLLVAAAVALYFLLR